MPDASTQVPCAARCARTGAAGGGVALAGFVLVTVAEHGLRADLDPLRHEVSEYANGSHGGVMTAGFAAWTLSLAATALAAWSARARAIGVGAAVASAGALLIAVCHTHAVAGAVPAGTTLGTAGRVHDIGGEVLAAGLLAAAAAAITTRPRTDTLARTALASVVAFVAATVVLLPMGASVGGLRQRITLGAAVLLQGAVLRDATGAETRPAAGQQPHRPRAPRPRRPAR